MNRRVVIAALAIAFLVGVLAANTVFVVGQTRQAIVLQFGRPVRVINAVGANDPGLQIKAPWESVVLLDKRNQALDADPVQVTASDQSQLVVQAFLRYRITDPMAFYTSLGDEATARDRLGRLINANLRDALASASSADIISGRCEALVQQAANTLSAQARAQRLGVQVIDLNIRRADLPDANAEAVFQRMKTEREQVAAQIKATGLQRSQEIHADADKQAAAILAAADADASRTRADGDAQRAALIAKSLGRDPSFADFYRTMQAYDSVLGQTDTTFVLSPDSAFLKYLRTGPSGR